MYYAVKAPHRPYPPGRQCQQESLSVLQSVQLVQQSCLYPHSTVQSCFYAARNRGSPRTACSERFFRTARTALFRPWVPVLGRLSCQLGISTSRHPQLCAALRCKLTHPRFPSSLCPHGRLRSVLYFVQRSCSHHQEMRLGAEAKLQPARRWCIAGRPACSL